MLQQYKRFLYYTMVLCMGIVFMGCEKLPRSLHEESHAIDHQVSQLTVHLKDQFKKYQILVKQKDHVSLRSYSLAEKWDQHFVTTQQLVEKLNGQTKKLNAIVRNNDKDDTSLVQTEIKSLKNAIPTLRENIFYVLKRAKLIRQMQKEANLIFNTMEKSYQKSVQSFDQLNTKMMEASKKYPKKEADINHKRQQIVKVYTPMADLFNRFKNELQKDSQQRDDGVLATTYTSFTEQEKRFFKENKKTNHQIDQLYRSYSKILTDMENRYFVSIIMSSWSERNSYYAKEKRYSLKPINISKKTYEYLSSLKSDEIASFSTGFFGNRLSIKIADSIYKSLDLKFSLPYGHDHASLWISKLNKTFYHQYTIIENTQVTTEPFVPVSEAFFIKHQAHLGMEIVSKPFGLYEEEKQENATPVGINRVGDESYGEWRRKTNPDGSSFLFWYFFNPFSSYSRFMGPSYYSYSDYEHYQRHRNKTSSYFGSNYQYGTWGSSTYKNTTYTNSKYARSNPRGVRDANNNQGNRYFKTASQDIKTAASRSRNRGPSRGGK